MKHVTLELTEDEAQDLTQAILVTISAVDVGDSLEEVLVPELEVEVPGYVHTPQ